MKNILLLLSLSCLFIQAQGQGLVFNLNAGIASGFSFDAFHDTANFYSASVKEGFKYALDAGYKVDRNFSVNLSLQYQKTTVQTDVRLNGIKLSPNLRTALLWIQVGGTSHFPIHRLELFVGSYFGAGVYNIANVPSVDKINPVRFAWSFRGGLVHWFAKYVGLNLRTDLLYSIDPLSKQFTPPGLMGGEKGFNSFSQFSFTAGIAIQLSPPKPKPNAKQ